jgi:diguanylate cyclase (GGDEF)-like protein
MIWFNPNDRLRGRFLAMMSDYKSLRILFVEDDEDYGAFLRILSGNLFPDSHSDHVLTAEAAIKQLTDEPYDLCFLDYDLGASTGLDVLRSVDTLGLKTAFVLLTAYEQRAVALEALQLGALDYLGKDGLTPFDFERCVTYALYRRRKEIDLTRTALRDPLTGLGNRILFYEQARLLAAQARRDRTAFCLVYIDIDGFKPVNDTLGHQVGDRLLQEFGERLGNRIRSSDVVARLGGDEFAVIFPRVESVDAARPVIDELIMTLCQPYEIDGKTITVGASVGAALFPDDADNVEDLIQLADARMYENKARHGTPSQT